MSLSLGLEISFDDDNHIWERDVLQLPEPSNLAQGKTFSTLKIATKKLIGRLDMIRGCDRHKVRFLSKCINCSTSFLIPSQWEVGECQHCGLQFEKMARQQQPLSSNSNIMNDE